MRNCSESGVGRKERKESPVRLNERPLVSKGRLKNIAESNAAKARIEWEKKNAH